MSRASRLTNPYYLYSPSRFMRTMEELLRPAWEEKQGPDIGRLPTNIKEDEDSYLVEVQLAGAELDEIQVSLDQDLLVITYERKRDRQEGPAKGVLQHEWFLESAKRTLQLPHADRDSEPQARFTGGVLTIEVFKRPENKSRRVSIR